MSILNPAETHWCERMQDMSGYVLPDLTSQPLDEQLNLTLSTTHHENDFYIQNPGNPSPEEVIMEDQSDGGLLEEDSDMFDNSNYSLLDTELNTWLPSTSEIDEFVKTTANDKIKDFLPPVDSENALLCVEAAKENKFSPTKKSTYFSIFECEEPHIKEDPDRLLDCCTNSKLSYRDEMEVAAEEVVITEDEEKPDVYLCDTKTSLDLNTLWRSAESMQLLVPKVEVVENLKPFADELSSPLTSFSAIEDYERSLDYSADQLSTNLGYMFECNETLSVQRSLPPLRLDIEAAKMSTNQLFGETLPDTPEVLKPVLKPETDFDLVNFLLATGDSNNNAFIPSCSSKKMDAMMPQEQRRGKSHLSLQDLKTSQVSRKRFLPETVVEEDQPSPTPSSDTFCDRLSLEADQGPSSQLTSTGRPRRESATRFNKRLEQGYLTSMLDSNSVSSDDENSYHTIKSKRRRTLSSSRSRLNSDSDQSIVCDSSRYRERRDKNNVSSKKSRQKRKQALEMKKYELQDLEKENLRLKTKAAELASVLDRVHKAWKEYLSSSVKEEPNEN